MNSKSLRGFPRSTEAPSCDQGNNDGFEDRVAAIRFSTFSAGLGGEVALTRGLPVIDLQAVGGLYDAIAREVFPDPLSPANFCQALAHEQHLDPGHAALSPLTAPQRAAVVSVDGMRNVNPRVIQCVVNGTTVTFHKEAASQPGGPPQHVYGAVRFLASPYSTFQRVRAGPAPDSAILRQMTTLVRSWNRF